ncbi:UDP-N-acetylglucosamine 1-carboxyvinyltransferase [Mesorhizobium sp. LSJC264A00]|uniref:UDP-N-acetylglucosamine 1-carboxyvinyltransferase n=1 Tax=Mesorhizobium sp. LSJC264A00 TaxID=1287321 RepID=UPI0003CEE51E|nr:UDP-N-acetylglucosamine 1-carboxyvinyltransferase [Mesorhizobium sp. LSJC264A00]ESX20448.1 UDP-N-acetylglucosamine 1-carboxyvinyltransferase [Mesorhizobium sp. LSJC264A00]
MDRIRIVGGNKLAGSIPISGAKNAALPLMIASLLTDDTLTLENVPHLADVEQLIRILGNHGVDYSVNGRREKQNEGYSRTINFSARNIVDTTAPYELVSKMRASFWVIGPLLARMGEAKVSLPGGCAIGTRPVDLFLEGLQALGADIDVDTGYVLAKTRNGRLTTAPFPAFPTDLQAQFMGLMTMAKGKSRITETIFENRFMHVQELARLGAHITLSGQTAIVDGVSKLKGAPVMATDLRASVSLVIAGLAAEGETTVNRVYHLDRGFERLEEKLSNCGAVIERISA